MDDRLFRVWTTSLAFDTGRYAIAAGVAFLVFWVWGRERWRHRLVQREFPPATNLRREVAYSVCTALIFSGVGTGLVYGTRAGVFRIYPTVGLHGWGYFAFTLVLLPVLHDTYFYWTHRAMHHRRLFKRVHRVHHLSHNPSPFAAYAFAPAEAVVQAAYVPLFALLVPVHVIALFVFLAFMILRNVLGHLGIELFPRPFVRSRWWCWSTTTTHHCLHHRRSGANYGLYFTWWDRLMGTMDPGYEETFEEVASRAPAGQ
ncbi:MAG TPA: sterol desaturase family protein [Polyangiaceae bacterium]|jgi:sterol desaturase/sphingolipid hydroxylase (fatty acid hydroxylase superfamily)